MPLADLEGMYAITCVYVHVSVYYVCVHMCTCIHDHTPQLRSSHYAMEDLRTH